MALPLGVEPDPTCLARPARWHTLVHDCQMRMSDRGQLYWVSNVWHGWHMFIRAGAGMALPLSVQPDRYALHDRHTGTCSCMLRQYAHQRFSHKQCALHDWHTLMYAKESVGSGAHILGDTNCLERSAHTQPQCSKTHGSAPQRSASPICLA